MCLQLELFGNELLIHTPEPASLRSYAEMPAEMRLSEFFDLYLESVRHRLKSAYYKERCLIRLERSFGNRFVAELKKVDLMEYIERERKNGKMFSSISVDLLNLSSVFTHVKKYYGWELQNPVAGLPFVASQKRVRYIEKEEAARLLECAKLTRNEALADFIELALNTGCRKGELLQLRFRDIDRKRNILTLDSKTTKTGKPRYIPINRSARIVFDRRDTFRQRYCPDSPWVFCKRSGDRYQAINWTFDKAVKLAGIRNFHIHDLRHTFASWLVSEGVELAKIRDLLGHSSITMTERYAHLAPDRLHDAVNVLDKLTR
ncbi:MAG: site-specific integrase [Candidatus Accumulibacter sp.]|jgi:integrase|nr:site-specific integrase [Accumulibacter sp.]